MRFQSHHILNNFYINSFLSIYYLYGIFEVEDNPKQSTRVLQFGQFFSIFLMWNKKSACTVL